MLKREETGLRKLNEIIDFVLKYGIEPRKNDKQLHNTLMNIKMAKSGKKQGVVFFESYDELCVERGVPDLLTLKESQTNSKTPENGYVSKIERNGLARLSGIIDYVLENGEIPTNHKLYYKLKVFVKAKYNTQAGLVHFESYDKLCIDRGVPNLLKKYKELKYAKE